MAIVEDIPFFHSNPYSKTVPQDHKTLTRIFHRVMQEFDQLALFHKGQSGEIRHIFQVLFLHLITEFPHWSIIFTRKIAQAIVRSIESSRCRTISVITVVSSRTCRACGPASSGIIVRQNVDVYASASPSKEASGG